MPTNFVKGDLFEDQLVKGPTGGTRALAFGADCSGGMTQGLAVAFKKRFPAFAEAFAAHAAAAKMQPGDVFMWKGRDGDVDVIVYALGLQHGDKKPTVTALVRALENMMKRALEDGATRIAMPLTFAGKDILDRTRVKRVLNETGEASAVDLVVYEQFVRSNKPS